MCQTLAELRHAVAYLAEHFDPALVAPDRLAQVVRDAGAIEKMMAALASLTAARMAASGPGTTAARQAVRELAHASGTSLFEATKALEASRQLEAQPDVASAARAGELSRHQLASVAGAVAVNAGAAPQLLALARTGSLQELSAEVGPVVGPPTRTSKRAERRFIWLGACARTPTHPARGTCMPRVSVSLRDGPEPSAAMRWISSRPVWSETKAIDLPSGEYWTSRSRAAPSVSCRRSPPSSSVGTLNNSPWTLRTTRLPSGAES